MDSQVQEQILTSLAMIVLGVLAWVLPYRWNLFRLRRGFASMFADSFNQKVPKVIGTLLILSGVIILVGTHLIGQG